MRFQFIPDKQDLYIDKFKEVITQDWIRKQTRHMYYQNQFKEIGSYFDLLHPIMEYHVDVWSSLRRAEALGDRTILMGKGNREMVNLGKNLYELDGLYNTEMYRTRLQQKELYHDACWELEVAQALRYNGFDVTFNDDSLVRYDLDARVLDTTIAIECKNKHNKDKSFVANSAFAYLLGSRAVEKLNKQGLALDLKVTIRGTAVFEDCKRVMTALTAMLREGNSQVIVEDQKISYKIEILERFRQYPTPVALQRMHNTHSCITGQERLVSELKKVYTEKENGSNFTNRIFFSIPEENDEIKNLQDLIRKANKQIGENIGCLFLHVPFGDFNTCKEEVRRVVFRNGYSNIHLIKVVSLKSSNHEMGVRVDRLEDSFINPRARNKIPPLLIERLSGDLFFSKYRSDLTS